MEALRPVGGRPAGALQDALDRGEAQTDLAYRLPPGAKGAVASLGAMRDEADAYCRAGQHVLTLACAPRSLAFRRWYLATLVLDCVGSEATLALAVSVAAGAGAIKVLGTGMGVLPFHTFALPLECSVSIGFWGGLGELAEVVALAEAGRLRTAVQRFPLSRVAEAYDELMAGRIRGRAVVVPD